MKKENEYDDENADERAYELAKKLADYFAYYQAYDDNLTEAVKHWRPLFKKAKIEGRRVEIDVRYCDPSIFLEIIDNPDYCVYFCMKD